MRSKYTLYHRIIKGKKSKYYQVQFNYPDDTKGPQLSTKTKNSAAAKKWADDYYDKNIKNGTPSNDTPIDTSNDTLGDFAEDFFDIKGRWAKSRKSLGFTPNARQCLEKNIMLKNHILPLLGKKKLSEIDMKVIKDFRIALSEKGLNGSSINKINTCVRMILESAEEDGIIKGTPKIERVKVLQKDRGVLTHIEAKALFADPTRWLNQRSYTASILSASTGMRLGEIQGLCYDCLDLQAGIIIVRRSWDRVIQHLNATTKNGEERTVIIPVKVAKALQDMINTTPYTREPSDFVFYGPTPDKPATHTMIVDSFHKALKSILKIDDKERAKRNIVFHSWRHYANSGLLNNGGNKFKVQFMIGHADDNMTDNYYHVDDLEDLREAQRLLIE
jgi:integrase